MSEFHSALDTSVSGLKALIQNSLKFSLARDASTATKRDWWLATSKAVQSIIVERMIATAAVHHNKNVKRVYYLSLEFLMGRLFSNNLYSAGVIDDMVHALEELGLDYDELRNEEYDMGLGNGGLGRLAACFLDSLATLDYPAIGYGIHYQYGLFKQEFRNGYQVELPDAWMQYGTPWEIVRPEHSTEIQVYGHVENVFDDRGNYVPRWVGWKKLLGIPYDIPVPGYGTNTVNFLRLWESRAPAEFDFEAFNRGGYDEAVREKNHSETISKVLYPNDNTESGKELRLLQQYFFVACSLKDIIRRFLKTNDDWEDFPDKVAIQLNDTHPAIAVVELQRLLHDEYGLKWEKAWSIVTRTFAYTNHTLLPEALEKWSVGLFQKVIPRHMQIIFDINKRFMDEVEARWPGDVHKKQVLSLIEEGPVQMVRMAHLAVLGGHSVNGVAELHTALLKRDLFPEFNELFPGRFNNKTNGITPRRWLANCNPGLAALITEAIGPGWITDLGQLSELARHADDPAFRERWRKIKRTNKERLLSYKQAEVDLTINPEALFDTQVKRIHEYKRQLLNVLHVIHLYDRIKRGDTADWTPRCVIFGGKAAPGYVMAKRIIKLINNVAHVINRDPSVGELLKVAFLPNYRVTAMEIICPGTDLSEQISTAGKEASGTGNMKFMLNGALTIGTLDGANIEIREEVGADNFFLFGLTAEQVEQTRPHYDPDAIIQGHEDLRRAMQLLESGHFNPFEPGIFDPIIHSIRSRSDPWMTAADFPSYVDAQKRAAAAYRDSEHWTRMSVLNCAASGKFSSDRTIQEYNREIWRLEPITPLPAR
jgi:starch phosphorylase